MLVYRIESCYYCWLIDINNSVKLPIFTEIYLENFATEQFVKINSTGSCESALLTSWSVSQEFYLSIFQRQRHL